MASRRSDRIRGGERGRRRGRAGGRPARPSGPRGRAERSLPAPDERGRAMLAVAAEELVRALAGQRHGHVLGRHPRQRVEAERREVGDRLVQVPEEVGQVDDVALVGELELVVIGPERLGDEARVGELVVAALVGEPDRERLHRLAHVPRHQRHDEARVEPAAQHRAEGDVAHQPVVRRLVEQVEEHLRPLVLAAGVAGRRGLGERPVALDANVAVRDHEPLARLELAHAGERRPRAGEEAHRQVDVDRLVVEVGRDEAAREHALQLGAEDDAGRRSARSRAA